MWLDKVRDLKEQTGTRTKYIAEKTHVSERTVRRFFAGETDPGIDFLREVVLLMGGSLDDILSESDFRLPTPEIEALKKENAALSTTIEELTAKTVLLQAEIAALNAKIGSLTAENDILRIKLEYEKKISDLHDYYNKLK